MFFCLVCLFVVIVVVFCLLWFVCLLFCFFPFSFFCLESVKDIVSSWLGAGSTAGVCNQHPLSP